MRQFFDLRKHTLLSSHSYVGRVEIMDLSIGLVILCMLPRVVINDKLPTTTSSSIRTTTEYDETMVEGDMLDFDPKPLGKSSYKSGLLMKEYLWPDATMHYRFDPNMTIWLRKQVRRAMKNIEANTCIRFVMYKDGMDVDDWYEIEQTPQPLFCASTVGLLCKNASLVVCNHKMKVGDECSLGSLVHELMHSLGFVHEQSRPDRDEHIIIHEKNIQEGRQRQFEKSAYPLRHVTPYDVESIMHYDPLAFSEPSKNLPTIQAVKPLPPGVRMGQRWKLSRYDIQKLNGLYNCTTTKAKRESKLMIDALEDYRLN